MWTNILQWNSLLCYANTEMGDVKAAIAVISFILSNATKFSVDAESLSNELQQLGLPKGRLSLHSNTHTHSCETSIMHKVELIDSLCNVVYSYSRYGWSFLPHVRNATTRFILSASFRLKQAAVVTSLSQAIIASDWLLARYCRLSICLSVTLCIVAKWYILRQKCLKEFVRSWSGWGLKIDYAHSVMAVLVYQSAFPLTLL